MDSIENLKAELRAATKAGDSARVDELLEQLHTAGQISGVRRAVNVDEIEKRG